MNYYLLKDFAESVLRGQAPLATGWDGRMGVATTVAAYRSIASHMPVSIS
jgi:predicted dehydrogenase